LDDAIRLYSNPATPVGNDTYYWTADDRGLSDYVNLAFRLFGARTVSLALFYYALLGTSLFFFTLAGWRTPFVLFAPVLVLLGLLGYAYACSHYAAITLGDGRAWQEAVSLYDPRAFESIAVIGSLQLALFACQREPPARTAWLAVIPQILLLVFLYHARSSLGWMYLALFVLAVGRLIAVGWTRRHATNSDLASYGRPLTVIVVVFASIVGLQQYERTMYHHSYFEDRGTRSVWHNALMGFGYAPRLRQVYDIGIDDTKVINLVLREMRKSNDPRLNPSWRLENIGGALGGVIQFDWRAYERAARDTYFGVWRREPAQAFMCYAWYKPSDLVRHTLQAGRLVGGDLGAGRATPLAVALAVVGGLLVIGVLKARSDPEACSQVRTLLATSLCLFAFSTVPAFAFYAALPTLSGFYVTLSVCIGLFTLVTLAFARPVES
jgi:hypothetical protein